MVVSKTVTLPELVDRLGAPLVAKEIGVDPSLPRKWRKGSAPSWRSVDALMDLAEKSGLKLVIRGYSR